MPFLVYEQDPFIRADICETLSDAFPEHDYVVVGEDGDLSASARNLKGPIVAILSIEQTGNLDAVKAFEASHGDAVFVLISDDLIENPNGYFLLQRPFSSGTLIASTREALSTHGKRGS